MCDADQIVYIRESRRRSIERLRDLNARMEQAINDLDVMRQQMMDAMTAELIADELLRAGPGDGCQNG